MSFLSFVCIMIVFKWLSFILFISFVLFITLNHLVCELCSRKKNKKPALLFVLPISVDVSANVSTIPLPHGTPSIVRWRSVGFSLRKKLPWQRVFCTVTSLTLKPDKAFTCRHITLSLHVALFRLFWLKGGCCRSVGDCALQRHSSMTPHCSSPIQRVSCCLQVAAGF